MTRVENTKERLDRAVANMGWRDIFQGSSITHLFSHTSDHRPILLHAVVAEAQGHSSLKKLG